MTFFYIISFHEIVIYNNKLAFAIIDILIDFGFFGIVGNFTLEVFSKGLVLFRYFGALVSALQ